MAIASDLNFRHAAEIFNGINDYLYSRRLDWQLVPLNFGFEARLMELAQSGRLDGAIGTFVSDRWLSGLKETGVQAVNLYHFSKIDTVSSVSVDDSYMGVLAARHLLEQGAQHLAFYADSMHYATELRWEGFQTAQGKKPVTRWSSQLPIEQQFAARDHQSRPEGIYCTNDRLARRVIQAAKQSGRVLGKDLLVLGTDDDASESVFAGIGISSFSIPARQIGKQAAQCMERALNGSEDMIREYLIDAIELVARESSLAQGRGRIAQRATQYIRDHLQDPSLDINQIAQQVGSSRRTLELAFVTHYGTSPHKQLTQLRLERARQMLESTNRSISEIAEACGYPEIHYFSAWFKKQSGLSPKQYRHSRLNEAEA